MWPNSYAQLVRRTQQRLSSIDHTSIEAPCGTIEYTERGQGHPILVLHGIFGGFDAAYLTADPWLGDGFRAIAPSRFGCLGSSLPPHATVADQADAYAVLLDALGIRQAAVVGFSAGTVSAMQFGLRHPGRTTALVLMSGHYPQRHHQLPALLLRLLYTDRVFWALRRFTPGPRGRRRAGSLWDGAAGGRPDPGARLVTIPRGGHLYLGAEARVRREVAAFIRAHLPRAALPGR
jgi:pimeloyl-ACP methyl ester carboxylesterase